MKADLEKILGIDTSRAIADIAIAEIEKDPELFEKAWEMALRDEYPISMRAARVVDECAERHPELIEPYLEEMIRKLPGFKVIGVKRCFLRFLVNAKPKLTPVLRGYLAETCFEWLTSSSSPIALKVYSMNILYDISQKEQEIKYELLSLLEEGMERNSFGYASRAKKIRALLYKDLRMKY